MALCPITIVSSCKNCPIFKICPAKDIIGDHKQPPEKKEGDKTEKQKQSNNWLKIKLITFTAYASFITVFVNYLSSGNVLEWYMGIAINMPSEI